MNSKTPESANLTNNVLDEIVTHKRSEVASREKSKPVEHLLERLPDAPAARGFEYALRQTIEAGDPAVIAEAKRASPSKGLIRQNFDIQEIAKSYAAGGATCLSVLTDEKYFQGHDDYLVTARNSCELPIIRKDFIVSTYQVYESKILGADCILLIVACLEDTELEEFSSLATALEMDVLIEVHDRTELERALRLRLPLIGINNRDLRSFVTDIQTTLSLLRDVTADRLIVSESGIHSKKDISVLRAHHVNAFLVGEAFMRADNPGDELQALFFN